MAVNPRTDAPVHDFDGVTFTSLASPSLGSSETSVWEVEVPAGTGGSPHRITREEILVLTAGRGTVRIGDDTTRVGAGDTVVVPSGVTFSLANTGEGPLRALALLPVGGQACLGDDTFTPPWAR